MGEPTGMRTMLARYRCQPGRADDVADALRRMGDAVASAEPACLIYRVSRSVEDPDVFVLYEEYVDEAALLAHRETPHFRELVEGTVVPMLESREREVLAPVLRPPGGTDG
ncbi:MAG TPA: antibiotic biosynthesis monooxygenase family protein [Actinomycetota bacterium]|nr:antibiotic biosynthesis monooxygenase family protein [Actinomycetota bacterium]